MGFGYAWEKDKHNNQLIDAAQEVRVDGAAGEMVLRLLLLPFCDQSFRTQSVQ